MNSILAFLGTQEIIIIAIVVVLLFGAKKIPQLMRGVGSGIKEFKDGMKEGEKDSQEKTDKKEINSSDN
ncbi:MAG: twin-arginine translocase TatA/TatE family subunit [Flavobacteriales bacterium]|nr:twin-arginine translocase TatA/TatE family subunit [Flavobacteriales bacterium]MCW8896519.1 twin-arginine translocase TatA/TatE family subunit [Flavobacteriales bacterium]MCW8912488.1 twin-arginine translocase TatA/TatE family subunit [Flavobacteriales bacterium]MCW8936572.1 twin-arginine translocase TatA/TatE family subunit [Flavobacteriales bacterium]MCW8940939.1 twin-arginine translocase TatA/TatE family subunit [Flavobacteriales bacterium]